MPAITAKRQLSRKGRLLKFLWRICLFLISLSLLGIIAIFAATNYPFQNNNSNYVSLPYYGTNFTTYSVVGNLTGRTYVQPKAAKTILDSYRELAQNNPKLVFKYGEAGNKAGRGFWPHRTHLNGLSVDFMTPMRDKTTGKSETLPTNLFTLWGYGIRLGPQTSYHNMEIDFAAICRHLAALNKAARANGLYLDLVIVEPPVLEALRQSPEYSKISNLPFMKGKAWFSHDGHYHVDFAPL